MGDLRSSITEKTSLTRFDVKYGYPPKPLYLDKATDLLSSLDVNIDGEQLTISAYDGPDTGGEVLKKDAGISKGTNKAVTSSPHKNRAESQSSSQIFFAGMPGTKAPKELKPGGPTDRLNDPISLKPKSKMMEVPELPLPDRGATIGMYMQHLSQGYWY